MDKLDELFEGMPEPDAGLDFVIDEDLRVIAVPELGVVLGVEGDKDVNRVRFRMNRNYRGTDLSGFNIRINYRSAEDEINYFPVTEKTVTDDAIYFVWLVGADTVAAKGTVYFVARFFTAEEDGTIAQEFNTTLGNARTLEGLVVDAQADDKPVKDLLAQLEYDLKTYTAPFVQQAKTYAENSAASADRAATYAADAETSSANAAQSAQSASAYANSAGSSAASAEESANRASAIVSIDKTLSVEGAPADAKAVGDAVKGVISADAVKTLIADALAEDHTKIKFWISVDPTSPAALFGGSWEEIASERVLMGASSTHAAGTTVEAGLPNITGSVVPKASNIYNLFISESGATITGAFYTTGVINTYACADVTSITTDLPQDLCFNASRSNSIYGRSSTVQPAAYYVRIWHRVA